MYVHQTSMRFLGGDPKKLTIPFFQRNYVWNEDNWRELLENFCSGEKDTFLGMIILKKQANKSVSESIITDGQQRITTVSVLFKAIFDCLPEEYRSNPDYPYLELAYSFLFYRNNTTDKHSDSHVKLCHSKLDRIPYETVIKAGLFKNKEIDLDSIDNSSNRILQCYKYYRSVFDKWETEELVRLVNRIFDEGNESIVLVSFEYDEENEQKIFDTINRAGTRLTSADIIKNNLFRECITKAKEAGVKETEVFDLYDKNWSQVFDKDETCQALWNQTRIFGNNTRTNIEFLLYCVAIIRWGKDKDVFSNLSKTYNDHIHDMDFTGLCGLISDIYEYGVIFKKFVIDLKKKLSEDPESVVFKYSDRIKLFLLELELLGVQMFYPYIIKRLKESDVDTNNAELKKDLAILESYIIRRKIVGKGTNAYADKCDLITREGIGALINKESDEQIMSIDNDAINYCLQSNLKNSDARMLLFVIELYMRREDRQDINGLSYVYTLEHIMPKKWERNWSDVQVYNETGETVEDIEEQKSIRNIAIGSIGNMTLLKSGFNKSLKNASFRDKIEGEEGKEGYKYYTDLRITREIVEKYRAGETVWDERYIKCRKQELFEKFVSIWKPLKKDEVPLANEEIDINESISDEAMDDPLLLLEELSRIEDSQREENYVSEIGFLSRINIQKETFLRYLGEGKIQPDHIASDGKRYYQESTIKRYISAFGWHEITEENRIEIFLEYIERMKMSYSYKPILLKAIFQNANPDGEITTDSLLDYFKEYFKDRKEKGLIVEKETSVFAREDMTDKDTLHSIITYPYARFAMLGMMHYDKTRGIISLNQQIWEALSAEKITYICQICDKKLDEYFSSLS